MLNAAHEYADLSHGHIRSIQYQTASWQRFALILGTFKVLCRSPYVVSSANLHAKATVSLRRTRTLWDYMHTPCV
ncbi:hypothetical protein A0H81_05974 [Grifola frondosa]|uniref:Uncharacterized protein n=1 Tax=Grifola frondosa TaxID=5627 RepID=A0A1C7MBN1_GRIFR|nr:hypothetical protein A0H81_05974 [Grifola frondosa]